MIRRVVIAVLALALPAAAREPFSHYNIAFDSMDDCAPEVQEELKLAIKEFDPDLGFSCEYGLAESLVSSPGSPLSRDPMGFVRSHPVLFGLPVKARLNLRSPNPGANVQLWRGRPVGNTYVSWGIQHNLIGGAPYFSLRVRLANLESGAPSVAVFVDEGEAAWSETIEGIRMGIRVTKEGREGYALHVYLQNVSTEPIDVPYFPEEKGRLAALGLNAEPHPPTAVIGALAAEAELAPGQSLSFVHALDAAAAPWLSGGGPLRVVFNPTLLPRPTATTWSHRIESSGLRLERSAGAEAGDERFAGWWAKPGGAPGVANAEFMRYLRTALARPTLDWPVDAYLKASALFLQAEDWPSVLSIVERKGGATDQRDDFVLALAGYQRTGPWPEAHAAFRAALKHPFAQTEFGRRNLLLAWKGPTVAGPSFVRDFRPGYAAARHRAYGETLLRQGYAGLAAVELERAHALGEETEGLYLLLLDGLRLSGDAEGFKRTSAVARAAYPDSPKIRAGAARAVASPSGGNAVGYPQWLAWSVPTQQVAGDLSGHNPAWSGNRLIYVRGGYGSQQVRSLDPETGRLFWAADLDQGIPPEERPGAPDSIDRRRDALRIVAQERKIAVSYVTYSKSAVDTSRNRGVLWLDAAGGGRIPPGPGFGGAEEPSRPVPGLVAPAVVQGELLLTLDGHALSGLDRATGRPRWRYPARDNSPIQPGTAAAVWTGFEARIIGVRPPPGFETMRAAILEAANSQQDPRLAAEILMTALDADPSNSRAYLALARLDVARQSAAVRARLEGFADFAVASSSEAAELAAAVKGQSPVLWSLAAGRVTGIAADAERVYVLGRDALRAVDSATGKEVWKLAVGKNGFADTSAFAERLTLDRGVLYAATEETETEQPALKAVEARGGRELWSRTFSPPCCSGLKSPRASGEAVYVQRSVLEGNRNRFEFHRLAKPDGSSRWISRWEPGLPPYGYVSAWSGAPAFAGGTVFFATEAGGLRALERATGKVLWTRQIEKSSGQNTLAFGDPVTDKKAVFAAGADGAVYAFDAATGAPLWKAAVGAEKWKGPDLRTLALVGRQVCFHHFDNRLVCLNAADGKQTWTRDFSFAYPPVVLNGLLWVASGTRVAALDPETGTLRADEEFPFVRHALGLFTDGTSLYLAYEDGVARIRPFAAKQ